MQSPETMFNTGKIIVSNGKDWLILSFRNVRNAEILDSNEGFQSFMSYRTSFISLLLCLSLLTIPVAEATSFDSLCPGFPDI